MKQAWMVDDDREILNAVRLLLRLLDYDTRAFHDARSAARALMDGERPDLFLLDISMPEVSGVDLLEYIRRRHDCNHIPVLMISADTTDVQVDQAMALGADGYLFKPVSLEDLKASIALAMENRLSRKSS